jgi:hypothetical protein
MMNNSKTYILAILAGATLFGVSFAIGANSDRVQPLSDNTRNFAYPKVDEIATVEPKTATTEPKQKERKRRNSTAAIATAAPKHRSIAPTRKVRVKVTEPSVDIPVPAAGKTPLDDDGNASQNPVKTMEEAVTHATEKASQPDEKQQSKPEEKPQEVQEENKQIQPKEKVVIKPSPEKPRKEVTPKDSPVAVPTEAKPELPIDPD